MLNRPWSSLTALRDFSISDELAASTVTPGRIAPEVSLTMPVIPLDCCALTAGAMTEAERTPARVTTTANRTIDKASRSTDRSESTGNGTSLKWSHCYERVMRCQRQSVRICTRTPCTSRADLRSSCG